MPTKTIIRPKNAAPPIGPYNIAVRVGDQIGRAHV